MDGKRDIPRTYATYLFVSILYAYIYVFDQGVTEGVAWLVFVSLWVNLHQVTCNQSFGTCNGIAI